MDAVQKANSRSSRVCRWEWRQPRTCSTREVMRHNPREPAAGRTATASSSAPATARCCSTRAAPVGLRRLARRPQAVPPVGLDHAGPPGARPRPRHAGRRGHDRPARPGLRQRRRHGDGRALPARALRPRGQDHRIYAIVSDGDLMEGVASEAASLAGHLGLGRLIYLYDDNDISLDGPTSLSFDRGRLRALRGLRLARRRGRRRQRPRRAASGDRRRACARRSAPRSSACTRSSASPRRTSRARARRTARRSARTRCARPRRRWAGIPDQHFARPRRRLRAHSARSLAARRCRPSGRQRFAPGARRTRRAPRSGTPPGPAAPLPGLAERAAGIVGRTRSRRAWPARSRWPPSRRSRRRWSAAPPTCRVDEHGASRRREHFTRDAAGRNVYFGVREHGDGRRRQRHGRARRHRAPLRLDVPAVRGLHARLAAPVGADGPPGRLGLHPRLRRRSARTARRISRSSTSRRCARSRA